MLNYVLCARLVQVWLCSQGTDASEKIEGGEKVTLWRVNVGTTTLRLKVWPLDLLRTLIMSVSWHMMTHNVTHDDMLYVSVMTHDDMHCVTVMTHDDTHIPNTTYT